MPTNAHLPPSMDPLACTRWLQRPQPQPAFLYEEVARRMQDRLELIRLKPKHWVHWHPTSGSVQTHAALAKRYPQAVAWVQEPSEQRMSWAKMQLQAPWWRAWAAPPKRFAAPPAGHAQMLWANMLLHMTAEPTAMLAAWHAALDVDGFVMFSALGPDSAQSLHAVHRVMGWPAPAHNLTDMHDWGDMLVGLGFAQPVMDMERITLTYANAVDLLADVRTLGRNVQPQRFAGLRAQQWRQKWLRAVEAHGERDLANGRLQLRFEIIYGHAFKAPPKLDKSGPAEMPILDMRSAMGRPPKG